MDDLKYSGQYFKGNRNNENNGNSDERKPNISFTGAKLDWMTAAAYDRRLKSSDFRVAFVIAQHISNKTGKAFPSQGEIADKANTSVDTVQRTIRLLQQTRWLTVRRKRTYDPKTKGWKTRNFYWLRHENVQPMFDLMKASKLDRLDFKGRTGAPSKSRTHAPLTPSYKHLQKGGSGSRGGESKKKAQVIKLEEAAAAAYKPQWSPGALMRMPDQLGYLVRLAECSCSTRH